MIDVRDAKGSVRFRIIGEALRSVDPYTGVSGAAVAPPNLEHPAFVHDGLHLAEVRRGLDGSVILVYRVQRDQYEVDAPYGDYVRYIARDGKGYWDLWRPGKVDEKRAYERVW